MGKKVALILGGNGGIGRFQHQGAERLPGLERHLNRDAGTEGFPIQHGVCLGHAIFGEKRYGRSGVGVKALFRGLAGITAIAAPAG